jgi:hypothetical protein
MSVVPEHLGTREKLDEHRGAKQVHSVARP